MSYSSQIKSALFLLGFMFISTLEDKFLSSLFFASLILVFCMYLEELKIKKS